MERGLGEEVGWGLGGEVSGGAGIKKKPKTKGFEPIPQRKPRENDLKCETQCVFSTVYDHVILYLESVKGGDPSPRSRRDTLLRLHPSRCPIRGRLRPLLVRSPTSGPNNSHGVTGGVYKARERIHRGMLIRDY